MKYMTNITIEQLNPGQRPDYSSLAEVYAQVFSGYQWYEVTRCPTKGPVSGQDKELGQLCTCCEDAPQVLTVAYPREETATYIEEELSLPGTIGMLGILNGPGGMGYRDIIAFSWAICTSPEDLAIRKWRTSEARAKISEALAPYSQDGQLLFGSEVGVLPGYQSEGIGTRLMQARLSAVEQAGLNLAGRTLAGSPMSKIYTRLGFRQLDCLDLDNPNRTLFIYEGQESIKNYPYQAGSH